MRVTLSLAAATVTLGALLTGCTPVSSNDDSAGDDSCAEILRNTISLIRAGQRGNGDDALSTSISMLAAGDCPGEYAVFADYSSSRAMVKSLGRQRCAELSGYLRPAAIRLLRQDGLCNPRGSADPVDRASQRYPRGDGISWETARNHVWTAQRVCGPLAGMGTSADDVFLNVGRDYPDPERFTIVLWDVGGVKPLPPRTWLCASGPITLYEGVAQIQLRSVGAVEVYN